MCVVQVNNLHGMPSLIGGVASIIAAAVASDTSYSTTDLVTVFGTHRSNSRTAGQQALFQLIYIATSIGIGAGAGFFCGLVARLPFFEPPADDDTDAVFQDSGWWEVPHLELPYYFDRRGEVSRGAGNLAQVNVAVGDGPSDGGQEAVGEVAQKARYQRLLDSKLEALRQELRAFKRLHSLQQQQPTQPTPMTSYTRPASPMHAGLVESKTAPQPPAMRSSSPLPPASSAAAFPSSSSYPAMPPSSSPPHSAYPGYPYFSYPQPYYGPHGPGTYAQLGNYQPTNNHNPIIPANMPYPSYSPTHTRTGSGHSQQQQQPASSDGQMEGLLAGLTRLLSRFEGSTSSSGQPSAAGQQPSPVDAAHKEL